MAREGLPAISGREAVRAFEQDGWQLVRHRGSHMVMSKPGVSVVLSIPNHREPKRGQAEGTPLILWASLLTHRSTAQKVPAALGLPLKTCHGQH